MDEDDYHEDQEIATGLFQRPLDSSFINNDTHLNVAIKRKPILILQALIRHENLPSLTNNHRILLHDSKLLVSTYLQSDETARLVRIEEMHSFVHLLFVELIQSNKYPLIQGLDTSWAVNKTLVHSDVLLQLQALGIPPDNTDPVNFGTIPNFNALSVYRQFFQDIVCLQNILDSGLSVPQSLLKRWKIQSIGKIKVIKLFSRADVVIVTFWLSTKSILAVCDKKCYSMSREFLLMMSDLIHERHLMYIACAIALHYQLPGYPSPNQLLGFLTYGDAILRIRGNSAYDLLKLLEPLASYRLMELNSEEIFDFNDYITPLSTSKPDSFEPEDVTAFYNLIKQTDNNNPAVTAQLFGLHRMWGHPIVDIKKGLSSVRGLAQPIKEISSEASSELSSIFKKLFVTAYTRIRGEWPPVILPFASNHYLVQTRKKNMPPVASNKENTMKEWNLVQLKKTFEIDTNLNLNDLISDKSLSLTRSELLEYVRKTSTIGPSRHRRVILQFLQRPPSTAKEILSRVSREGFSLEQQVIGVLEKERELKIAPRLFALLTLEVRLYFVLTEQITAEYFLPYFPQITMKYSQKKLLDILYSMTEFSKNNLAKLNSILVNINIDFEKWNTNMRKTSTDPIFRELDTLIGFPNVFTRTHEIFANSLIYSASMDAELAYDAQNHSLVHNDYVWSGHLGGLEGLRQKPWTIMTVCTIARTLERFDVPYKLIGQGDNQVLQLQINLPNFIKQEKTFERIRSWVVDQTNLICESMALNAEKYGLFIKMEETWRSTTLFAYGKMLYWRGAQLPMSLKRIARCFPLANQLFPTFEADISTLYGAATAAAGYDFTPIVSYYVVSLEAQRLIDRYQDYTLLHGEGVFNILNHFKINSWFLEGNVRQKVSITTSLGDNWTSFLRKLKRLLPYWPSCLGGLPTMTLLGLMYRGNADNVTLDLAYLYRIHQYADSSLQELLKIPLFPLLSANRDTSILLENPSSINPITPGTSTRVMAKETTSMIESPDVVNTPFTEYLNFATKAYRTLAQELLALPDPHVYFLGDVLSASLPGTAKHTLDKVTKSSTLLAFSAMTPSSNIRTEIERIEMNHWMYAYWTIIESVTRRTINVPLCAANYSRTLREMGWGKDIKDATVPHAMDLLHNPEVEGMCAHCASADFNQNYIRVYTDNMTIVEDRFQKLGRYRPYIGAETKERLGATVLEGMKIIKDPIVKKIMTLMRVRGWIVPIDSPCDKALLRLYKTLTNLNPEFFTAVYHDSTGEEAHRYHSEKDLKTGMYNGLYNPLSHMAADSCKMIDYPRDGPNYLIHYQSLFLHTLSIINIGLLMNSKIRQGAVFHFHLRCVECIEIPPEDCFYTSPIWDTIRFPAGNSENPYCFVKFPEDIDFSRKLMSGTIKKILSSDQASIAEVTNSLAYKASLPVYKMMIHSFNQATGIASVQPKIPAGVVVSVGIDKLCEALFCLLIARKAKNSHQAGYLPPLTRIIREVVTECSIYPASVFSPWTNLITKAGHLQELMESAVWCSSVSVSIRGTIGGLEILKSAFMQKIESFQDPSLLLDQFIHTVHLLATESTNELYEAKEMLSEKFALVRFIDPASTGLCTKLINEMCSRKSQITEHVRILSFHSSTPLIREAFIKGTTVLAGTMSHLQRKIHCSDRLVTNAADPGLSTLRPKSLLFLSHRELTNSVYRSDFESPPELHQIPSSLENSFVRCRIQQPFIHTRHFHTWSRILPSCKIMGGKVLVFGDGAGALSYLVTAINPRCKAVINRLPIELRDTPLESDIQVGGFELILSAEQREALAHDGSSALIYGNILDSAHRERILRNIDRPELCVFDIEGAQKKDWFWDHVSSLLDFVIKLKSVTFVIKLRARYEEDVWTLGKALNCFYSTIECRVLEPVLDFPSELFFIATDYHEPYENTVQECLSSRGNVLLSAPSRSLCITRISNPMDGQTQHDNIILNALGKSWIAVAETCSGVPLHKYSDPDFWVSWLRTQMNSLRASFNRDERTTYRSSRTLDQKIVREILTALIVLQYARREYLGPTVLSPGVIQVVYIIKRGGYVELLTKWTREPFSAINCVKNGVLQGQSVCIDYKTDAEFWKRIFRSVEALKRHISRGNHAMPVSFEYRVVEEQQRIFKDESKVIIPINPYARHVLTDMDRARNTGVLHHFLADAEVLRS